MEIASQQVKELYQTYNSVIKPLIAEIEARIEQFPLPLFNEIRALHDHISRCYVDGITESQVADQLQKAHRHLVRIMLDCYKCLILALHDVVLQFERQTKHIDLTVLQNGTFYPEYTLLRTKAVATVRRAKVAEAADYQVALDIYQEAYNTYTDIEVLIDSISADVHWARVRFTVRRIIQFLLWIASAVASGMISIVLAKYL